MEQVSKLAVNPQRTRVYAEGWQSWSPTRVYRWGEASYLPEGRWQHAMRFRPGRDLPGEAVSAEGLLAVDSGEGEAVAYLGPSPTEVPSLVARWGDDTVVVSSDGPVREFRGTSLSTVLAAAGNSLSPGPLAVAPRVWCSWYRYFGCVAAEDVAENTRAMATLGLPYDVVQIDDGWSLGNGEYQRGRPGFGDLGALVSQIQSNGRRAGLWLAPFLVGVGSTLAREHPDWLVGYGGFNWGQDQAGLDLTHPGVRAYLREQVEAAVALGVNYLKLDFLYAGALPGARHDGSSPLSAYRSGLALIRDAAGPGTYLLGCGAPILPSVGLVDAMRISPDTFHEGSQAAASGLRGAMSCASRSWQDGRLWANDPDCLVATPTYEHREQWAAILARYGSLRSTSDRLADLDDWGLARTRALLGAGPVAPRPRSAELVESGLATGFDHRHRLNGQPLVVSP